MTVQGVPVQSRSTSASNGIIYYLVAPIEPANGTVADVIKSESDLSTLLTAAQAAGIVEFLIGEYFGLSFFFFFFFQKAANIILLMVLSLLRRLRRFGSLWY